MFMQEKQKYNFSIILNLFQELTKRPTIITNDENNTPPSLQIMLLATWGGI